MWITTTSIDMTKGEADEESGYGLQLVVKERNNGLGLERKKHGRKSQGVTRVFFYSSMYPMIDPHLS